jgi:phage-related protein
MARRIEIDLVGDTADFERSMGKATASVDKLDTELKNTAGQASKFDSALDTTTSKLGSTTNGMRSTADLAGGLGDVLGVSALGPIAGYATGMADIADGMGGLLAPALTKAKSAFLAMNTTLLANPIFLVVAALVALTAAFVIAYKKSETFREIVDGALKWVKNAAKITLDYISNAVKKAAEVIAKVADIITTPYQLAFKAIAWAWNNTIGKLSFSIPGWVPGLGGKGFDVPDIPTFAKGGIVNGPTLAMVGDNPGGREAIIPLSGPNAGGLGTKVTIVVATGASDLDELIRKRVRVLGNGSVQRAYGMA